MKRPCRILTIGLTACLLMLPAPTFAKTYAYIPSYGDNTVVRIDTASETFSNVTLDSHPYGAVVNPKGTYVLVTCTDGDTESTAGDMLVRITNANFSGSGTPLTVAVGNDPRGVAVDATGNFAYVANYSDNTVSEIYLSSFTVNTTIDVGAGPWGVAVYYDEDTEETIAYVANSSDGTISVIRDGILDDAIDIGVRPIGLALSPDGSRLYIADNNMGVSGDLVVVRTSDMTVIETIAMDNAPWGVAVGSDGDAVYVTGNRDTAPGTISIFSPADGSLVDVAVDAIGLTGVAAPKKRHLRLCGQQRKQYHISSRRRHPFGRCPGRGQNRRCLRPGRLHRRHAALHPQRPFGRRRGDRGHHPDLE